MPPRTVPTHPVGRRVAAVAALLAGAGAGAQPLQWTGHVAVASELTDRGLLVGPRRPSLQAALTAVHNQRWTWSFSASVPSGHERQGRVSAQVGRYERLSDDWQLDAGLAYYAYPGDTVAARANRWELQAGAAYRDLLSLGVAALHFPAWPGQRAGLQWALDLGLRWPLAAGWSATASLGQADVPAQPRWRYRYGGLGLAWQTADWRLELNRLGSDDTARRVSGAAADARWSATLTRAW